MENISYKWRTIGELLGLPFSKLENLAMEHCYKPEHCCRSVLGYWLDNPPPRYPTTWRGLIELLEDSQLGQIVHQLKQRRLVAKLVGLACFIIVPVILATIGIAMYVVTIIILNLQNVHNMLSYPLIRDDRLI